MGFSVPIGNPKEDGDFLAWGFSAPVQVAGRRARWCARRCCLFLPVKRGAIVKLTLNPPGEQRLVVLCEGKEVGRFELRPNEWNTVEVALPADLPEAEELAEFTLDFERAYRRVYSGACAALSEASVEGVEWPAAPEWRPTYKDFNLYFGDLHFHTDLSECDRGYSGSLDENYRFAKERAGLDFASATDHAEHMTEEMWRLTVEKADEWTEEGKFVAIPAFEWTSELFGHRNVYYLHSEWAMLFDSTDPATDSPHKLYRAVRDADERALVVPHHPCQPGFPLPWEDSDPEEERLVEIFSKWGSSEFYGNPLQRSEAQFPGGFVLDALAKGFKFGFVGGSDGHALRPGMRGLTAVWAKRLSREAIFDALWERRCYATTGAKIRLEFTVGGYLMGREVVVNQYQAEALYPLEVVVRAVGTAPIVKVEVVENGIVKFSEQFFDPHGFVLKGWPQGMGGEQRKFVVARWRVDYPVKLRHLSRYFYARVYQADGHMAWSSPVFITVRRDVG